MPDADGNVRGISVPADAWERIFRERLAERHEREKPLYDRLGDGDETTDCGHE